VGNHSATLLGGFPVRGDNGFLDLFVSRTAATRASGSTPTLLTPTRAPCRPCTGPSVGRRTGRGQCGRRSRQEGIQDGDYLRYALFDKYFKVMGCQDPAAQRRGLRRRPLLAVVVLRLGGSLAKAGGWSWRIGASASHSGYQNRSRRTCWPRRRPSSPHLRTPRATGAPAWAASSSSIAGCSPRKVAWQAARPIAGAAATPYHPRAPPLSTRWPTTRRRFTRIRPAMSGSGSRPGPWTAWRSSIM